MLKIMLQRCALKQTLTACRHLITNRLYQTQTTQMPINGKFRGSVNSKFANTGAQMRVFSVKSGTGDINDSESAKHSGKLTHEDSNDSEFISEKEPLAPGIKDLKTTGNPIDVDAEMLRYDYEEFDQMGVVTEEKMERKPKKALPISLNRGQSGVFEIEELCTLLKNDNVRDICVIAVPPEFNYVDFFIFGTGRSTRHIRAVAEYIKWAYKQRRSNNDPQTVKIEGENTPDWFALDLGNIAVHLMLPNTRVTYDLEQLWSVGPEHDEQVQLQSLSDVAAAASLEEFSFDSELERFKKLRAEEAKQASLHSDSSEKQKKLKTVTKFSMESQTDWHRSLN